MTTQPTEDLAQELAYQHAIEVVRERNPQDLEANYARSMQDLREVYLQAHQNADTSDFEKLKDKFKQHFATTIFKKLAHATSIDLGDEVDLKSPKLLGQSKNSGPLDEMIGNTSYVFCASPISASRSFMTYQSIAYEVDSRDCYVVPMDISYLHYDETERVQRYARNLYTYEQFCDVYAAFCCNVFPDPEEALRIFGAYHYYPDLASAWKPDSTALMDEPDKKYFDKMIEIFSKYGIIPPISPEFQFKDVVHGKKLVDQSSDLE